jgi:hypothetical protein
MEASRETSACRKRGEKERGKGNLAGPRRREVDQDRSLVDLHQPDHREDRDDHDHRDDIA